MRYYCLTESLIQTLLISFSSAALSNLCCFRSCRISTDKLGALSFCLSRCIEAAGPRSTWRS